MSGPCFCLGDSAHSAELEKQQLARDMEEDLAQQHGAIERLQREQHELRQGNARLAQLLQEAHEQAQAQEQAREFARDAVGVKLASAAAASGFGASRRSSVCSAASNQSTAMLLCH